MNAFGIELDQAASEFLASEGLSVWSDLEQMPEARRGETQVVTMFHVLEHPPDTRLFLRDAIEELPNARLFVSEVPYCEDPLLSLYKCQTFSHFTYSYHYEQLYSKQSLESLLASLFDVREVTRPQPYGLAKHLGWLSRGKPGGQVAMSWLERSPSDVEYRSEVMVQGFSDTLCAVARTPVNSAGR